MGTGVGQATGQLSQLGNAANQADRATGNLETRVMSTGERFTRLSLGIGSAVSGIFSLVRSYTGLQSAQARVTTMASREINANLKLNKARETLAAVVAEYGANSEEAALATEKLRAAELAAEGAAQRHDVAQTNLNTRLANFAASVVPSAISVVAGLVQTFDILTRSSQAASQAQLTGTLENTSATIQSTGATLNATSATEIDTAATLEGVAAQLESTGATAQNTAAQISNTGAVNANAAASLKSIGAVNGLAAAQTRAGTAATGMGLRMKAALIGTGIGAILVALGGFLLAFSHNWFGVKDAVNAAGKAIGDALPWLQGLLNMLKEAGEWMSRLFGVGIPEGLDSSAESLEAFGDTAAETADKIKELQKSLVEKIFTGQERVAEAFNIKLKDPDKIQKELMKSLPDRIEKDIKASVKLDLNMKTAKEEISHQLWAAIGSAKIDDSEMDKVVENTMKYLADKFPNHSESRKMQEQLAATISGTDTKDKVAALIEAWDATPIAVEISPENINTLITGLTGALTGTTFEVPVTPVGTGSLFDLTDEEWDKMGEETVTGGLLQQLQKFITTDIPNFIKQAGTALANPATWISAVNAAGGGLTLVGTAIWNFIKQPFTDFARTHIDPIVASLLDPNTWIAAVNAFGSGLLLVGTAIGNFLVAGLTAFFEDPVGSITKVSTAIQTGLEGAFAALTSVDWAGIGNSILTGIGDWFSTNLPETTTAFTDMIDGIATGLKNAILNAPETLKSIASVLWEEIKSQFLGLFGGLIPSADIPGPRDDINPLDSEGYLLISDKNKKVTGADAYFPGFTQAISDAMNKFALMKQAMMQGMQQLSQVWNTTMIAMSSIAGTAAIAITQQMAGMIVSVSAGMSGLAATWSAICNSFGANAQSGASQIIAAFEAVQKALSAAFKAMATAAKAAFNAIVSGAKSATSAIKSTTSAANSLVSALKKVESAAKKAAAAQAKVGMARGGVLSFAEGGIMSAATGRMFTTNGATQVTVGDNPGGRETVAFIPHNDPGPTLERLMQLFGGLQMGVNTSRGNASVSVGHGGNGGTPIIQVFLDGKQIKGEVVQMLARNQSAMK